MWSNVGVILQSSLPRLLRDLIIKDSHGMVSKEQVVFLSPITTAPVRAYLPVSDSFTSIPILTH